MTEKLTPIEILKSKQNFSNFMADTPAFIVSTLADYPQADGKVILEVAELTQNFETFANLLDDPMVENLPQPPFVVWTVTNPKDRVLQKVRAINKYATSGFGIFVFKAFLNEDKIDFECLVKPEIKYREGGIAKQHQLAYWQEFNTVNIKKKLGWKIKPKTQHWQYLPIGKRGVSIMISANTQEKLIGVDLIINYDESIYNRLYEHKKEIEKELGTLEWVNKPKNKSCKVRKTLPCDITDSSKYEEIIEKHIELTNEFKTVISKYLD